ncbi:MAG: AMP-binding protein [Bradymonadaceae bacterium]
MADTIIELFENRVNASGIAPALFYSRDGLWESQSWKDWWEQSERVAAGLLEWGVRPGDTVVLVVSTRLEWAWLDMAMAMIQVVTVPIEHDMAPDRCAEILAEVRPRALVVEDPALLRRIAASADTIPARVVCLDEEILLFGQESKESTNIRPGTRRSLPELVAHGRRDLSRDHGKVARLRRETRPETPASIVYTAGTSGEARGVLLSHGGFAAQVSNLSALGLFTSDDLQLLAIPLASIFAKTLYLTGIGCGMKLAFGSKKGRCIDDLVEVRPTVLAGMPSVFAGLREELEEPRDGAPFSTRFFEIAHSRGLVIQRRLAFGGIRAKIARVEGNLLKKGFFSEFHDLMGGRLRVLLSGGATLEASLAEWFGALGVPILDGYGLTEACGAVTLNLPEDFKYGTVGRPVPGVDVTIAEDHEVLLKAKTKMLGYIGDHSPGIDEEGWLHTSDLGYFDRQGFLTLTGRKTDHEKN